MAKPYTQCAYIGYGCMVQHAFGLPDVLAWPVVSLHIGNNTHIYGQQVLEARYACHKLSCRNGLDNNVLQQHGKASSRKTGAVYPKGSSLASQNVVANLGSFFSFFSIKIKTLKFSILYDNFLSDFIQSYIQNDTKTS